MKKIIKILIFALLCCSFLVPSVIAETEDAAGKESPVKKRIKWEEVEGAIEYRIQLADLTGKIVVDRVVVENYVDVEVPYGYYKIRIGAVNKFGKIGSWSDWANISILEKVKEPEPEEEEPGYEFVKYQPLFIRIGLGPSFFFLFPEWDDLYDNSYNSISIHLGVSPLEFSYFRYAGIEIEGTFARFKSKSEQWRIKTEMKNILTGCNLFYTTCFAFPVNMIFRLGGGIAYTEQEYEKFDSSNIHSNATATLTSQDPFYRAGLSAEWRITKNLFLEAGVDYYIVRFLTSDLKALRCFVLAGTGF